MDVTTNGATVPDPTMRIRYHRGDVLLKLMADANDMTLGLLAARSGVSRGTVGGLLNNTKDTEPENVAAIAHVFGLTVEELDNEVKRLNQEPVLQMPRTEQTREEDKDPVKNEAIQFGHRIGRLPLAARSAIYAIVAALEEAYFRK